MSLDRAEGSAIGAFLRYEIGTLEALPPPLEAIAVGGSVGVDDMDPSADVDFFLLVAEGDCLRYAPCFPELITHPTAPIARWSRGFSADFGYQHTFIYRSGLSVDYNLKARAQA